MVQIKQKKGTGVKNPPPRSFWCGIGHQCVAVVQSVAVCCSVLQCVWKYKHTVIARKLVHLKKAFVYAAVRCSALQCVAVRCSALQCAVVKTIPRLQKKAVVHS